MSERDLRRMVAEHVMGLQVQEVTVTDSAWGEAVYVAGRDWAEVGALIYHKPGKALPYVVPDYLHDSDALLSVIEHVAQKHHWSIRSPFTQGGRWIAGLTPLGSTGWNGRPDVQVMAKSLPIAVCMAACCVAGVDESQLAQFACTIERDEIERMRNGGLEGDQQ